MEGLLDRHRSTLRIRPEDGHLSALAAVATALGLHPTVSEDELVVPGAEERAAELNRAAFAAGIVVPELRVERPSLESSFFALTDAEEA